MPALSHEVKARRGPGVLSEGDSDLSQHVDLGGALAAHDLHGLAVVEEAARAHGVLDVARHGVPRVTDGDVLHLPQVPWRRLTLTNISMLYPLSLQPLSSTLPVVYSSDGKKKKVLHSLRDCVGYFLL